MAGRRRCSSKGCQRLQAGGQRRRRCPAVLNQLPRTWQRLAPLRTRQLRRAMQQRSFQSCLSARQHRRPSSDPLHPQLLCRREGKVTRLPRRPAAPTREAHPSLRCPPCSTWLSPLMQRWRRCARARHTPPTLSFLDHTPSVSRCNSLPFWPPALSPVDSCCSGHAHQGGPAAAAHLAPGGD